MQITKEKLKKRIDFDNSDIETERGKLKKEGKEIPFFLMSEEEQDNYLNEKIRKHNIKNLI